jgi:hypothetical protein
MSKTKDVIKSNTTVYLVWSVAHGGFVQGRSSRSYGTDLSKARIYSRKNHATSSCGSGENWVVVPIDISINPAIITQLTISGSSTNG